MSIIVNTNSYFSVDEANNIMLTMISTGSLVNLWNNLSDDDKEAVIINSTEKYDNNKMEYIGVKKDVNQPLQFPRVIDQDKIIECPYKIKKGLLLQGLLDVVSDQDSSLEYSLKLNGVKQFSDGSGASVTFDDVANIDKQIVGSGIHKDIFEAYFSEYSTIGTIQWL